MIAELLLYVLRKSLWRMKWGIKCRFLLITGTTIQSQVKFKLQRHKLFKNRTNALRAKWAWLNTKCNASVFAHFSQCSCHFPFQNPCCLNSKCMGILVLQWGVVRHNVGTSLSWKSRERLHDCTWQDLRGCNAALNVVMLMIGLFAISF